MSNETTALITADNERIQAALVQPDIMQALLAEVRAHIDAFEPDATTEAGRAEIKSLAYAVARSKTTLDAVGKDFVAEAKAKIKLVDDARKLARDTLDAWKDEVRQPVTEWEARQKQAQDAIVRMGEIAQNPGDSIEEIENALAEVRAIQPADMPEETQPAVRDAQDKAIATISEKLIKERKAEADRAELERLREEAAKREAQAERERIASEAAEKARKEAEAKAARETEEARMRAEKAEADRKLAEQRALDAEARAKREAQEAQERKAAAEKAAADKRAADAENRSRVMNEAYLDLLVVGADKATAREVVVAIAAGQVRHVAINF